MIPSLVRKTLTTYQGNFAIFKCSQNTFNFEKAAPFMSDDKPPGQTMTIQQAIELAVEHHNAGRLPDAENIYQQVLKAEPNHPVALNLMGVIAHQVGKNDIAVDYISRALEIQPDYSEALYNLGKGLKELGRFDEAIAAYYRALGINPNDVNAHYNLANLLKQRGRPEDAVMNYQKAVTLDPQFSAGHNNLGLVQQELGRWEAALESYQKAIAINPNYAEALNNQGNVLKDFGRHDEALESYDKALALAPDYAEAYSNRGLLLQDMKRLDEALEDHQKALKLLPNSPKAISNLGFAHQELGQLEQATNFYNEALAIDPTYVLAHNNLGLVFQTQGMFDMALSAYKKAVEVEPKSAESHHNLGMLQLLLGDFENGWDNYAWRWKLKDRSLRLREYNQPQWRGEDLNGKTVLVYPEQGIGDVIQIARYMPLLKAGGASVILEVPAPIRKLIEQGGLADQVIAVNDTPPAFDCHIPLLDLPHLMETRLKTIPENGPYLNAPADKTETWAELIAKDKGLRVGIVWGGNPTHKNDHNRSIDPSLFQLLAEVPDVDLYSLQMGRSGEADRVSRDKITDLAPHIQDFSDTAAAVHHLDLVITVDTSVAHLAGAMGAAAWVLLPFIPDWRWLLERADSPWYPSLKLFRQKTRKNWNGVLEEVSKQLMDKVSS